MCLQCDTVDQLRMLRPIAFPKRGQQGALPESRNCDNVAEISTRALLVFDPSLSIRYHDVPDRLPVTDKVNEGEKCQTLHHNWHIPF